MPIDLVVNPNARVEVDLNDHKRLLLTAPKPHESLMSLSIAADEHPELFDLLSELAQSSLTFLDIRNDLTEPDRELLLSTGFLIERGSQTEIPLFACYLDEIEPANENIDLSRLIVNPSFRFHPFDLANFRSRLEQHVSPYAPTVSVTVPVTGVELSYWISHEQAEMISRFEPGKSFDPKVDSDLIRKLAAAKIVVDPKILDKTAARLKLKLNEAHSKFVESRYAVLPEILPPAQMAAMRRFYRAYVDAGFMPFGDPQVSNRFRQHNEPFAATLHRSCALLMSRIVGEEVIPSYSYAASYKEGASLRPHTDREQCEYSISFQVDYTPEQSGQRSPWPLYVEPLGLSTDGISDDWFDEYSKERPGKIGVNLASGDGLIYKGRELVHYRFKLPPGHRSTSLFFHYVPETFTGSLD